MLTRTAKRIVALAIAAPLLVATAACSTDGGNADLPQELVWTVAGGNLDNAHMDPHSSQMGISGQIHRQTFDSLVWLGEGGEVQPWLATEWSVNDARTEYTFTLREDVKFHDGEPFNAAAAVKNFDHVAAESTASAKALEYIGGKSFLGAEATGEFELKLTLAEPFAPFLANLSTPFLGFYSPKALEDNTQDQLRAGGPEQQIGSGPFILEKYVVNQELVLTRNPDYAWGPEGVEHNGAAKLDTVTVRIVPEEAGRIAALTSGDAQVSIDISSNALSQLDGQVELKRVPNAGMPDAVYLNTSRGPFQDTLVRQAFMYGINIDEDVNAAFDGAYQRAWSILSPTLGGAYDDSLENAWNFDQKKAAALLDEAGWTEVGSDGIRTKDGERLSVEWLSWTPYSDENYALANFMIQDLKEIGFELVHNAIAGPDYQARYFSNEEGFILDFELTDWAYSSLDADALRNHLHTNGYQNASRVYNADLDTILEKAASSTDPDERNRLYKEVQQWNLDNAAIVPLYLPEGITAYTKTVHGLVFDALGWPVFYGANLQ